jgi:hypothetical protein
MTMAPRKKGKKGKSQTLPKDLEQLKGVIAKLIRDLKKTLKALETALEDANNAVEIVGPPPHFGPRCNG